ncbi:hypothetical protein [Burkholderia pyrrocinia]|uniref:Uncharacterized protein n=1 Tax=Burkholderia pyrrocinia TaxID=60550 RepID=A0ABZ3BJ00_BURPY
MNGTRLLLKNTYANGAAVSQGSYEVEDAHGRIFKGTLDETGCAVVVGLAPGPVRVRFGGDPADPWAESGHGGSPVWPAVPVEARSVSRSAYLEALLADALAAQRAAPGFATARPGATREAIRRWQAANPDPRWKVQP